ncbi:L,D-transpeptidase [Lichenihabitans psoromatis]|uniref:L,D-transpeptidase n=1 Tax=Lichenihabitans psoromatis TaxID=2528642 RepID=UPI001036736F|nr:L,D-transpeptidase [Lichenihabitans psoromatis]
MSISARSMSWPTIIGAVAVSWLLGAGTAGATAALVAFEGDATPSTIVIRTGERRLYLILDGGRALRYTVGVGRVGRQWSGQSAIEEKFLRPNWAPPPAVRHDRPNLPDVIPSGAAGNPMGAAAMTLSGGNYAIHGTNAPKSIGGFVSYGCIRMYNDDIVDLFGRVDVGTRVIVTR